ncbi:GTPase Era [Saccharopolyspora subtropica]|uniref:GTPase Era n=1 Tax=Saccharopolyspora thermophila TaxID=89367 RepID=A0A917N9W2_9PSEU|nr:GTPase Era [Saccharopolyspora subtropica]
MKGTGDRAGTQVEAHPETPAGVGTNFRHIGEHPAGVAPLTGKGGAPGRERAGHNGVVTTSDVHRSGFACFVGRPNAGKSTLTNSLVGTKVAITSSKPQTTRHAIRGIVHRPDAQLIIVDTPGLHRPRTLLGRRLNDLVYETWSEVDVVGFCVPADQKIGPGDRFIAEQLAKVGRRTPVLGIVTKTDLVGKEQVAQQLLDLQRVMDFADLIPVSAVDSFQIDLLADLLVQQLPEGPQLYPDGELTDEPETTLVAELIREAALEGVRDELPHSLAVTVEEMTPREGRDNLVDVYAVIHVERASQKAIVIGRGGERLRAVGSQARRHIQALLGSKIYLDLHVKVSKDWQRDPKQLRKLGF